MVLPALWVGVETAQLQTERAQREIERELGRRLGLAGDRLDLVHRRVQVHLQLLVNSPSLEDFHRYQELGLGEEASVHQARLQELATTLHEGEPALTGIGLLRPGGEALAWSGALRSWSPPAGEGRQTWAAPTPGEPGVAMAWLASRDAWGELEAWAVAVLDRESLLRHIEPGHGMQLRLRPHRDADVAPSGDLERRRAGKTWDIVLRADRDRVDAAGAAARRQALHTAGFSMLAAILLAAWLARRIAARIRRLADQASAIGEGRVEAVSPDLQEDEVGFLSRSLNSMGLRIQSTQRALASRVDELERTKDQLVHAEKLSAIGTLTAGVAHEIHSPIQAIQMSAGTLRMLDASLTEQEGELAEIADEITEAVGHVLEVTTALRDYARAPDEDFQPGPTDVSEVVDRVIRLLRAQRGVDRLAVSGEAHPAHADARRLTQAILNLVRNALDTCEDEPVDIEIYDAAFEAELISTAAERQGPNQEGKSLPAPRPGDPAVAIRIRDRGPGMTPELMRRAFDPFFTTKPASEGTGLGLSVTQGIIWQHGGLLILRSQPGKGLTVTVLLPAAGEFTEEIDPP